MLGVVDIGLGNNESIYKLLRKYGLEYSVIRHSNDLTCVNKLIFPGVGTFKEASARLINSGLMKGIHDYIRNDQAYLGICLGMQLMARSGHEVVTSKGLGVIDAEVIRMTPCNNLSLPHIGWNSVRHDGEGIFSNIAIDDDFYFVHSYFMQLEGDCPHYNFNYGGDFTAYVRLGKAHGVQFHPEKSQKAGQQLIKNFLEC